MKHFVLFSIALFGVSSALRVSLNDVPSVKLHVSLKRKAMEIHGQLEFDVYANPVVSSHGDRLLYDGYATFYDDGVQFTYALVDGAASLATNESQSAFTEQSDDTVRCLPPSSLPFNSILPALNGATAIPSAAIGDIMVECESGNLFKTTFANIHYAVCSTGDDGFTAFSSDLTIDIEYLDKPVRIPSPQLSDGSSCKAVAKPTPVTPTTLALITGTPIPKKSSRVLKEATHLAIEAAACGCETLPRPCIFFHGLGNEKEEPGLLDSIRHFGWNKLQGHAPCCTTIKYASLNTVDFGWTSLELQDKVCERALMATNSTASTTRSIDNTIVVTHSMGGLMFAAALANKKCTLAPSSKWIALSPPMSGSMSSDYLIDYCNNEVQDFISGIFFNGKCPASRATESVVYKGEKHSSPSHDAAYDAASAVYRDKVFAAMCSTSYTGNISKYQAKYMIAGHKIPHKSSMNDGLVEFESCAGGLPSTLFGRTPRDKFYRCELNHADTAFKTGDGIFKDTVRPIKWFECLL